MVDDITAFSYKGGNGLRPSGNGLRLAVYSFLLISTMVTSAFGARWSLAADDGSGIKPMSLGVPEDCLFTSANALGYGPYPGRLTVAGSVTCGGDDGFPYVWRDAAWTAVDFPTQGYEQGWAQSLADDDPVEPTLTFAMYSGETGWESYVKSAGSEPLELGLLDGMTIVSKTLLSADGDHVAGNQSSGNWETGYTYKATRWLREGSGPLAPEELYTGEVVGISADGSMVLGNTDPDSWFQNGGPWIWMESPEGGGTVTLLDATARVEGMDDSGMIIVGARPKPCSSDRCDVMPGPVYWLLEDGQWTMHDLEALDGVDSIARDAAIVNGKYVIVGYGFTNEQGGILRPVTWVADNEGAFGPPVRLETIGDNFESWAEAYAVNESGVVLGWSELGPFQGSADVIWNLLSDFPFRINAGISDAWYDNSTDGQGFMIMVWEDIQQVFLTWFTYEVVRPDDPSAAILGDPGHRWLTAQGAYEGNRAELQVTMTEGGVFDSASPTPTRRSDGTITLEFSSCVEGTATYDIPSIGRQGTVMLQRLTSSNVADCEKRAALSQ